MKKMKRRRELLPRWDMPSDPIKAVFWFTHWLLKVLVRFFWLLIIGGVVYESILNGVVGGVVTFLVGLLVWAGLAAVLLVFNLSTGVTEVLSEVKRAQRGVPPRRSTYSFAEPDFTYAEPDTDAKVVEGSITDLEEERKKRRPE